MSRPPRTDEASGPHHALNHGDSRATIFHKDNDCETFQRILADEHFLTVCRLVERDALRAGLVQRAEA